MKAYVIWNENRTEGYITTDPQLAYEVRKGSQGNCYDDCGNHMPLATVACEVLDSDEMMYLNIPGVIGNSI